jgi:protein tyrosine kinase modulator
MKRLWVILVPFVLGTLAGAVIYVQTPERYRSETLIMVIPQRVPETYVKSTVTATVADRLTSINEQILSRSRLERIVTDFDLYPTLRRGGIMEDVIATMRKDIHVDPPTEENNSFRVSYTSNSAATAQKVTERLASLYIEENLRDRNSLAENTSLFLESQLEDAQRRLREHEKKLEQYQKSYAGQLPQQLQGNLQAISNAQMQLTAVGESINRARERRLLLERQLGDAESLPASMVLNSDPSQRSSAQQLEAARQTLEAMRLRYTPDHPDIKTAERTIKELQAKVDQEARLARENPNKPVSPTEVARQRQIRELKDQMADIDRQIGNSEEESRKLKATISDYQSRIDILPTRESELVELTRDYDTLKRTYDSLLMKREDSKLAANLERGQIGEQFRILDPASMPERPSNQKERLAFGLGGCFGGLALGLLLVGFLEYRDASLKTEGDVMRVLSLPVLALVPIMGPQAEPRPQHRSRWRSALGLSALFVVVACAAALAIWTR